MKLSDLGERRIITDLLYPRYAAREGRRYYEDCALLDIGNGQILAVTTDPCPKPMAYMLGETDPYYYGWLLATINLSDLAAVGAQPLTLLTSLIAPADMPVADFSRLLDGVDDACQQANTKVGGGNIKEGPDLQCSATGVGLCVAGRELRRGGARPGDLLLVIGELGDFWAFALNRLRALGVPDAPLERGRRNVLTPTARIREGLALAELGRVTSCMDNSDGLYACAKELANANELSVVLDFRSAKFSDGVVEVATRLGIRPHRLALGWGDWQLVITANPADLDIIVKTISEAGGAEVHVVGRTERGLPQVLFDNGQSVAEMYPLDSERFVADSWFSAGIDVYVEQLIEGDDCI